MGPTYKPSLIKDVVRQIAKHVERHAKEVNPKATRPFVIPRDMEDWLASLCVVVHGVSENKAREVLGHLHNINYFIYDDEVKPKMAKKKKTRGKK